MLGWLFLGLIGAGLPWMILTDYAGYGSILGGAVGVSYEPLTSTQLFTDWLTWALTDYSGLMMLFGMGLTFMVLLMNALSDSGDLIR